MASPARFHTGVNLAVLIIAYDTSIPADLVLPHPFVLLHPTTRFQYTRVACT